MKRLSSNRASASGLVGSAGMGGLHLDAQEVAGESGQLRGRRDDGDSVVGEPAQRRPQVGLLAGGGLPVDVDMTLDEVARWVFSALVSELLRDVVGRTDGGGDRQLVLRTRVRVLLRGLGAA